MIQSAKNANLCGEFHSTARVAVQKGQVVAQVAKLQDNYSQLPCTGCLLSYTLKKV